MTRFFSLLLFSVVFTLFSFFSLKPEDALPQIIEKLMSFQAHRPQEKLFIHLDKPYYSAGENIWFKTYLVDGTYHHFDSTFSKVIYVDLLNSGHQVLQQRILYSPAGISIGDFKLDDSLPTGQYLLRGYTNYMKNAGEDFFFLKEFKVFNSQDDKNSSNSPLTSPSIDLQFFPEGGYLVSGIENRISFKAINKYGKAIEVTGEIVDEKNGTIATFSSEHKGMGSFKMFVWPEKKYFAKLTIAGINGLIPLPEVKEKGYLMQVTETKESIRVMIYNNFPRSPENPVMFNLVGQTRGEVYFAASGELKNTTMTANIPKSKFPTGVAQLTVFDGAGVPQCERLVFVDHGEKLDVAVETNKEKYGKREKVEMNITVRNEKQEPVSGNFSVSIYDQTTMQDEEEYSSNIVDYLLLSTDLTGHIEDPSYYLKDKLPETVRHLDLVMLTHGWRRFTWKEVLQGELKPLTHYAEKGIRLSGKITRSLSPKPMANSKVKVLNTQGDLLMIMTDSEGRFYSDEFAYYDSTKLAVQTENEKGKQIELSVKLDTYPDSYTSTYSFAPFKELQVDKFLEQADKKKRADATYKIDADTQLLEEVVVQASKVEEPSKSKLYGTPTSRLKMKDIPNNSYTNVLQALQGKVAGVVVRGTPPSMTISLRSGNDGLPLFLVDGTPVDLEIVNTIPPENVDYIDVVKGTAAAIYGNRGINGVLAIYTKRGANIDRPSVGIQHLRYPGFYAGREFYSPQYDVPSPEQAREDIRTTLYWNPLIETDEKGNAKVSFFTSDDISSYKIVIQGLSYTGFPGYGLNTLQTNQ